MIFEYHGNPAVDCQVLPVKTAAMNNEHDPDETRRTLMGMGAAALIGGAAIVGHASPKAEAAPVAVSPRRVPPGRRGEFDFLQGEWLIDNRKRRSGSDEWDRFPGEATVQTLLAGVVSVEELRIPARQFSGMGLRILDQEKNVWVDYWVNAKSGVLGAEGTAGGFENGIGSFISEDVDGETRVLVRGVWDRITPQSCRWSQSISRDGGQTWRDDWIMDWTRA
jgi:hypothetical protein